MIPELETINQKLFSRIKALSRSHARFNIQNREGILLQAIQFYFLMIRNRDVEENLPVKGDGRLQRLIALLSG
jgi:hypothetical protein